MLFEATAYISFGQPSRTCERPTLSSGRYHWRASRKSTVTTACTNVHKQQEKHGGKTVSSWEHPRTKHRKILVHTQNTPLDYCYCIDRFFASTQNTSIGMAKKQNLPRRMNTCCHPPTRLRRIFSGGSADPSGGHERKKPSCEALLIITGRRGVS